MKDPNTGVITNSTNLTILNVFLLRFGPMNEKRLVQVLICSQVCIYITTVNCVGSLNPAFQIAGSLLAFFIRYGLAGLIYDGDRR